MPRFRLETALHVRERLEMLYQKALAEQVKVEQQYRDKKTAYGRNFKPPS